MGESPTMEDLGLPARFLTGDGALKYHLYKLGKAEDQMCRLCQEDAKNTFCVKVFLSKLDIVERFKKN